MVASPKLLIPPFTADLLELFKPGVAPVHIATPWLKVSVLEELIAGATDLKHWSVLTRGLPNDFRKGTSDLSAFERLVALGAKVYLHQRIHAKVYVVGVGDLIVGSNNLTVAGTRVNLELAVRLADPVVALATRSVLQRWMERALLIDQVWCGKMKAVLDALPKLTKEETDPVTQVPAELLGPTTRPSYLEALVALATDALHDSPPADTEAEGAAVGLPDQDGQVTPGDAGDEEPPKGTTAGTYADVPMPESWWAWLPVPATPSAPVGDGLALLEWREEAEGTLDHRELDILRLRYDQRATLQEIGDKYEFERERARQIEADAIDAIRTNASDPGPLLGAAPLDRLLGSVRIPAGREARLDGTVELVGDVVGLEVDVATVGDRMGFAERGHLTTLLGMMKSEFHLPRFVPLANLSAKLGLTPEAVQALAVLVPDLRLSSACAGWDWSKQDLLEALAHLAAEHGVIEWHASAMAKAMAATNPERCASMNGRLVINILSRKSQEVFTSAGRKGIWMLREFGDGFRTTLEAMLGILSLYEDPLHATAIHAQLERKVPFQNVVALLSKEEFKALGKNVYGLATKDYASVTPTQAWLKQQLAPGEVGWLDKLEALAKADGLRPEALVGAAHSSPSLRYLPGNAKVGPRIVRQAKDVE